MRILLLFSFFVIISLDILSQNLTVIKKNGRFNTDSKTLTYRYTFLSMNGKTGKIICRRKGVNESPNLKEYAFPKMDSLYQIAEKIILRDLLLGITENDTIVNGFRYVWKDAVLRRKKQIKLPEYKLKIIKVH